jgi:hypothetical protein
MRPRQSQRCNSEVQRRVAKLTEELVFDDNLSLSIVLRPDVSGMRPKDCTLACERKLARNIPILWSCHSDLAALDC